MEFEMENVPLSQLSDDGLSANQCYPQQLVNDPTFAILNEDSYFLRNGRQPYDFMNPPTPQMTQGQNPPFRKRWLEMEEDQHLAWDNGNSTRPLTERELQDVAEYIERKRKQDELDGLAYIECVGESCATEVTALTRYVSYLVSLTPLHGPAAD